MWDFRAARTLAPRHTQHGAMKTRQRARQGAKDAPLPSQPAREPDPWQNNARVAEERCETLRELQMQLLLWHPARSRYPPFSSWPGPVPPQGGLLTCQRAGGAGLRERAGGRTER